MTILYNLIFILFAIAYLPYYLLKRKFHKGFKTRLGALPVEELAKLKGQKVIWLHAVSVGEVMVSRPLLQALQRVTSYKLLVSTVTKTGNELAKKILRPEDALIYLPLDLSFITRRVAREIQPSLFILVETEIWPNLISQISAVGASIVIVNGRISPKSFKWYKLARKFLRAILLKIDLFCMQSAQDAAKIIELGAPRERVRITGNMKFDIQEAPSDFAKKTQEIRRFLALSEQDRLLIAGSTHKGEEEVLIRVYKRLATKHPNLKLLIAPRHIERAPEVQACVARNGLRSVRVSELKNRDRHLKNRDRYHFSGGTGKMVSVPIFQVSVPIFILDTLGELGLVYNFGHVVFVGGSLIPRGGHNMIEPARLAKPIVFGPHVYNFQDVVDLFQMHAACVMVKNETQLEEAVYNLLQDHNEREGLGARARRVVKESSGATARNMDLIMSEILHR